MIALFCPGLRAQHSDNNFIAEIPPDCQASSDDQPQKPPMIRSVVGSQQTCHFTREEGRLLFGRRGATYG